MDWRDGCQYSLVMKITNGYTSSNNSNYRGPMTVLSYAPADLRPKRIRGGVPVRQPLPGGRALLPLT